MLPYNTAGQAALPGYLNQIGQNRTDLTNAFNTAQGSIPGVMTQAKLMQMPGYQFQLNAGLQSVQNSNAAKGLGISGNALKGAANFATGLANSNQNTLFGQQQSIFNDQNQQFSNAYNKANSLYNQMYGPVALGENAAAQTGIQGTTAAGNAGTNIAGAGQALGAGTVAGANALAGGLNNASGLGLFNSLYNKSQASSNGDTPYSNLDPNNQSVAQNTWSSQPDAYYLPGGAGYTGG